jgi:hypothetical protein
MPAMSKQVLDTSQVLDLFVYNVSPDEVRTPHQIADKVLAAEAWCAPRRQVPTRYRPPGSLLH